jgi:hypothetical protein
MTAGSFFGAAQDGIKRHDDGKVLHNAAESGTQRHKTAHNAAQVPAASRRPARQLACPRLAFSARRLAPVASILARRFFGAAQDGIERHDDGKSLHSAAKIGTQRQKAARFWHDPGTILVQTP